MPDGEPDGVLPQFSSRLFPVQKVNKAASIGAISIPDVHAKINRFMNDTFWERTDRRIAAIRGISYDDLMAEREARDRRLEGFLRWLDGDDFAIYREAASKAPFADQGNKCRLNQ